MLRCKIGSSYFYSETMKYQNMKHLLRKCIGESSLFNSALYRPNRSTVEPYFHTYDASAYLGAQRKAVHQMSSSLYSFFFKAKQNKPCKSRAGYRNVFHYRVSQADQGSCTCDQFFCRDFPRKMQKQSAHVCLSFISVIQE